MTFTLRNAQEPRGTQELRVHAKARMWGAGTDRAYCCWMVMNILMVDDDEDSSSILAGMLRSEGYGVERCSNAALALVQLAATPYDVMMTDQTMPGMKGTELVVAARLLQTGLRCIIATGHNPPEESLRGDAIWITKPLDVDTLIALFGPASATAA